MKNLSIVIFTVLILVLLLPFTEGTPEKRSLAITSLTIKFDKTDAIFTVNYDFDKLPKMYLLLLGSRNLEPKIKSVFSKFNYEIIKIDQNRAILRVKNFSRFDKGYYLHDSHIKFGEGIKTIYIYTPDSSEPKKYSNLYMFSWDSVPGNDSNRLLNLLRDDFDINRIDNARIIKTDGNKTILVLTEDKSIEISLDENREKAILTISDGRIYNLQVREENDKLDIYSNYIYSTPNIFYRQ